MRSPWWRVGWRNLGRNRRRSIIAATTLAVGYWSVVMLVGWTQGLVAEMIGNGTGILTGQLQVHAADFRPDESVHATIGGRDGVDVAALVANVEADPAVSAATPRVYGGGLVSSGAATAAAVFLGVHPEREARVSRILRSIDRGRVPQSGTREILIGSEMARTLNVNPGDEVVVVAPAVDGSLGNDLFTVAGVYRSGLTDLDRTFVMLPIDALQSLMVFESNRVHEIAAAVPSPWDAEQAATRLDATLQSGAAPLLVESWATLRPEMVEYAQLTESLEGILLAIVFGMAIFGIANTMLMATYERRREFAVLLALGARPAGILWSVLAEAVALALVGLVVGVATALPVLVWWHNAPPDLSWLFGEFTMLGALIRPVLRVEYPWSVTVQAAFAMVLTAVVASVYPAIRAARLPPADTLAGR